MQFPIKTSCEFLFFMWEFRYNPFTSSESVLFPLVKPLMERTVIYRLTFPPSLPRLCAVVGLPGDSWVLACGVLLGAEEKQDQGCFSLYHNFILFFG